MIENHPKRPWDQEAPENREYFALLGNGLVAEVPKRAPGGSGSGGWAPPSGGAWVHVGEDGRVRAFTGKVEVGQGTRTALSMIVAEELRVPLAQVDLTMGDTDLSPWDMGTFGSRSMPDALPPLRLASAAARLALLELASKRWKVPATELEAAHGTVRAKDRTTTVGYGELVRGLHEVVHASPETPVRPAPQWSLAGHPALDPGTEDVVTGRRTYPSDLRLPGMRYGALLHPPRYGARLKSLDASALDGRAGILVVHEEGFAGVVAPTPWEAHAALEELDATWEETPQPSEDEIEAYLRSHPDQGDAWDTARRREGDPAAALASAAFRLSAVYRAAYIAHAPLETRACVAAWERDRLSIWLGTQTPFRARDQVAQSLGVPVTHVRVRVPHTGSGFGGKHSGDLATATARLARAAKAPVQIVYTRAEEFQFGYFRPYTMVDLEAGADRDGKLTAWTLHNVNGGAAALGGPYHVPNLAIDNELSASPLPQGAYRAIGATVNNFARESAIDEVATGLSIDPLAFRERNLTDERLLTVLRKAAEMAGWSQRAKGDGKGAGLAVGMEKGGRVASVAELSVDRDRKVRLDRVVTVFEAGAIVHPDNLRSQVEGATVMALGGALFEAIHFDRGTVLNRRFSNYRVPRFSDLPKVEVALIDRPDQPSAGGGETPMTAVAPAIANAIFDATGVRLRELPLLPDGRVPTLTPPGVAPFRRPPRPT